MFNSYQQPEEESAKLLPHFKEFEEDHDATLVSRAGADFTKAAATKSFRVLFLLFGVVSVCLFFVSSSKPNQTSAAFEFTSLDSFGNPATCPPGSDNPDGYCTACCPVTTFAPSLDPSQMPTAHPSEKPSALPTQDPSFVPSVLPTQDPSFVPSILPTQNPSFVPSVLPTQDPSFVPSVLPTQDPSFVPSTAPVPTPGPSLIPTAAPVPIAGLLHRYSFNDGTAGDSIDQSNGILQSGAVVANGSLILTTAKSSYVQLPPNVLGTSKSISVEVWATNGVTDGQYGRIFQFGTSLTTNYNSIVMYCVKDLYAIYLRETTNTAVLYSDVKFSEVPMVEKHMVMTVTTLSGSTQTICLYADGVLVSTITTTVPLPSSSAGGFIGKSFISTDPYINSNINEFRVWSIALTAAQVKANYINGPDSVTQV